MGAMSEAVLPLNAASDSVSPFLGQGVANPQSDRSPNCRHNSQGIILLFG